MPSTSSLAPSRRDLGTDIGTNLTPTQWRALSKLTGASPRSQNQLGRLTAMDVATIKGVIDRPTARGRHVRIRKMEDGRWSGFGTGQQLAE
jgi:DNA-binding MarR family transcriptional regulator